MVRFDWACSVPVGFDLVSLGCLVDLVLNGLGLNLTDLDWVGLGWIWLCLVDLVWLTSVLNLELILKYPGLNLML